MPLSLYTIESGVRTMADDPLTVRPNDFLSDVAVDADDDVIDSDLVSSGPRCAAWNSSLVVRAGFFEVPGSVPAPELEFSLERTSTSRSSISCGCCWCWC